MTKEFWLVVCEAIFLPGKAVVVVCKDEGGKTFVKWVKKQFHLRTEGGGGRGGKWLEPEDK
jgi:hypothetical protein